MTVEQISEQLQALKDNLQLQTMVSVLIYAGLRREELLWLTHKDVDLGAGPYASQALASTNRTAKLPWSCLDYRHTFGTQLAMKGESLHKISKLMGNSPEICRRHYAALVPEDLVCAVES